MIKKSGTIKKLGRSNKFGIFIAIGIVSLLVAMLAEAAPPILLLPRTLKLVSKNTNGEKGNRDSGEYHRHVAISRNGQIVAFLSEATNLDPVDDHYNRDAFVRNRQTGETKCISKLDTVLHHDVHNVDISEDGHYVVYVRDHWDPQHWKRTNEMYVYDRTRDTTYWVTENFPYAQWGFWVNGFSNPSISADGSRIAFEVYYASGGMRISRCPTVFIYFCDYDHALFAFDTVAQDYFGSDWSPCAEYPVISGDGRYVAFAVWWLDDDYIPGVYSDYPQVVVRNVETFELPVTLISKNLNGDPGSGESGEDNIDISYDGRFVTFGSKANDLIENDTNGYWIWDIFVRDRDPDKNGVFDEGNGENGLISISKDGDIGGNYSSYVPCVSRNGRYIAFHSYASNLISSDNNDADIFLRDRILSRTILISFSLLDTLPQAGSGGKGVAISGNGRVVAFGSSSRLTEEDDDGYDDVYVNYPRIFVKPFEPCSLQNRTGVDDGEAHGVTTLIGIYPNPTTRGTGIHYQLAGRSTVSISVYDVNGRLVRMLQNEVKNPGNYVAYWDGADDVGRDLASGIYIINFAADNYERLEKTILLR